VFEPLIALRVRAIPGGDHVLLQARHVRMTERCYSCDSEALPVRKPREILIGQRAVTVEAEFMRCSGCGEAFFVPNQADAFQRLAADQIRREDGLLTAGEVKDFRERLRLSPAEFERLLGTAPKSVARWERGTVTQSSTADTLMRILMKHAEALHDLALERSVRIDTRYFGIRDDIAAAEQQIGRGEGVEHETAPANLLRRLGR
jgi:putative zinc finger/helix-turn-helix YgiT family protein